MVRDLTDNNNQAESAPTLDAVDSGDAMPSFIQFRGGSTNVSVDDFNLIFTTEERNGRIAHKPLPVVTEDEARSGGAPRNAVVLPVAVELVRTNNLFGFGAACEECGEVFETTKALDGHQSSHRDAPDDNGGDQ